MGTRPALSAFTPATGEGAPMRTRIRSTLTLLILAAAALGSCSQAPTAEETHQQPIINGTTVFSDPGVWNVLVSLPYPCPGAPSGTACACSGTLLDNQHILTAKHCVADFGTSHWSRPPLASEVSVVDLNVNGAGLAKIDWFDVHPTLDVAVMKLSVPFTLNGSTNSFTQKLWWQSTSALLNQDVTCYGYGFDTFSNSDNGGGHLRSALLRVGATSTDTVTFFPNASGQIQFQGDSGSSCFANVGGNLYNTSVLSSCGWSNGVVTNCIATSMASIRSWLEEHLMTVPGKIGGPFDASGPGAASWGADNFTVAATDTNKNVQVRKWTLAAGWDPSFTSLGAPPGGATSAPTLVSRMSGHIDLFVRGGNNSIYQRWFDTSINGWNTDGWYSHGGYCTSAPAVSSWEAGRLDLFCNSQGAIYHGYWAVNTGWHEWVESLGAPPPGATSEPAAISRMSNLIDMFVLGGDNMIWQKSWTGSGWNGWTSRGGPVASAPSVASFQSDRVDLFARGSDGAFYQTTYFGAWWGGNWAKMPQGIYSGRPAAVSQGHNNIELFGRGTDTNLWVSQYPR
jgi:hypothetical protein